MKGNPNQKIKGNPNKTKSKEIQTKQKKEIKENPNTTKTKKIKGNSNETVGINCASQNKSQFNVSPKTFNFLL